MQSSAMTLVDFLPARSHLAQDIATNKRKRRQILSFIKAALVPVLLSSFFVLVVVLHAFSPHARAKAWQPFQTTELGDTAYVTGIEDVAVIVTGAYRFWGKIEPQVWRHVVRPLRATLLGNFLQLPVNEVEISPQERHRKAQWNKLQPPARLLARPEFAKTTQVAEGVHLDATWRFNRFGRGVPTAQIFNQHYSKYVGAQFVEHYERRHRGGRKFKFIVQIRGDWMWLGDISSILVPAYVSAVLNTTTAIAEANTTAQMHILVPAQLPYGGIDDRFAMGPRDAMIRMLKHGTEVFQQPAPDHMRGLLGETFFEYLLADLDATVYEVNVPMVLYNDAKRYALPECFRNTTFRTQARGCRTLARSRPAAEAGSTCTYSACDQPTTQPDTPPGPKPMEHPLSKALSSRGGKHSIA